MSKINTNQTIDFEPVGVSRKGDVKEVKAGKLQSAKQRQNIGNDKLNFSDRATEAAKHLDRLKELPDVRREKVDGFRAQISAGEYNPSSDAIADAIFRDEK